jgi:hypothetical protein
MTDNDDGAAAPSRDDVLAQVRAHFAKLREETEAMPDNQARSTLFTTMDNALSPLIEHMEAAAEHADVLHAAYAYLGMCQRAVESHLPTRNRNRMRECFDETTTIVQNYKVNITEVSTATLADSVQALSRCLDTQVSAVVTQLTEIACELKAINTTFQPGGPAAMAGANFLAVLSDIDLTLTDSMEQLVGSLPGKSQAVKEILNCSTNPPSSPEPMPTGVAGGAS